MCEIKEEKGKEKEKTLPLPKNFSFSRDDTSHPLPVSWNVTRVVIGYWSREYAKRIRQKSVENSSSTPWTFIASKIERLLFYLIMWKHARARACVRSLNTRWKNIPKDILYFLAISRAVASALIARKNFVWKFRTSGYISYPILHNCLENTERKRK